MNELFLLSNEILPVRRTYQKPRITMLGDLQTATLGGSPGQLDSGGPNPQATRPPGTYMPGQQDVI